MTNPPHWKLLSFRRLSQQALVFVGYMLHRSLAIETRLKPLTHLCEQYSLFWFAETKPNEQDEQNDTYIVDMRIAFQHISCSAKRVDSRNDAAIYVSRPRSVMRKANKLINNKRY